MEINVVTVSKHLDRKLILKGKKLNNCVTLHLWSALNCTKWIYIGCENSSVAFENEMRGRTAIPQF